MSPYALPLYYGTKIDCHFFESTRLRDATEKVIKKHFKDSFKQDRVEFLPVEWRSSLKLDEGNGTACILLLAN